MRCAAAGVETECVLSGALANSSRRELRNDVIGGVGSIRTTVPSSSWKEASQIQEHPHTCSNDPWVEIDLRHSLQNGLYTTKEGFHVEP